MLNWFRKTRSLQDALNETKEVKINGVIFHIRRVGVLDHVSGAKTLMQSFQTYEDERAAKKANEPPLDKIKAHYRDMIMASVVKPKLTRDLKKDPDATHIDEILKAGDMADQLYNAILEFTYGKKKLMQLFQTYPNQGLSS